MPCCGFKLVFKLSFFFQKSVKVELRPLFTEPFNYVMTWGVAVA
jgi:hypothetical protein